MSSQAQPSAAGTPAPTPEVGFQCALCSFHLIVSLKVKRKDAKPEKNEKPPPSVISADHGHGKKLWPFKK
jgi:hypothetical protein